jgi:DNA-binding response OmpR family regulator
MIVNTPLAILHLHAEDTDTRRLAGLVREGNPRSRIWSVMSLREAQTIFRDHPVDLVLLELPSANNQAYRYFQRYFTQLKAYPVILLSGKGNEIIGMQAIRAGAQDYLVSPPQDARSFYRALQFGVQRFQIQQQCENRWRKLSTSIRKREVQQAMVSLGHWEMDLLSQEIHCDRFSQELLGLYEGQHVISRSGLLDRILPRDREKVETFLQGLSSANEARELEFRVQLSGSRIRELESKAQIYLEEGREDILVLGYFRETQKSLVAAGEITRPSSPQSTMFTLRERMLDDIGFFVRTPLYSIVNFIHLFEDVPLRKPQQDALFGLKQSMDELQHYLNRLLNFSLLTKETPTPSAKPFDLRNDLNLISRLLYLNTKEDKVNLEVQLDPQIPVSVSGDQAILYRIMVTLYDLLRNLETSPRRISIHITMENQVNQWFNLRVLCRDSFNYPPNLPYRELLEKGALAEQYHERPENENVSRMSLITLHELVQAMNGSIRLNQLSNGSLRLILSMPFQLHTRQELPVSIQEWIEPIRILLVEDHFLNQIATRTVITSWSEDIQVDIAENGLVAVQKFREHGYDLILMDIQMPVMNGLDAIKKIRETSQVPIIALSAVSSELEARRCLEAGAHFYMAKPFQPDELKTQVFRLVNSMR